MTDILKGLNEAQKKAVTTTQGPLLIIAGAGTGKTTVITRRIGHLIEQKLAKPSEILALTFTEKAAGEMEERIDVIVPYGFVDTWISTFHSFGNRVLQENALDLGLPPDFKVLTRPAQVLFFQQNLFSFDLDYYRPLGNPTKFIEAILSFISRAKDEDISAEQYQRYVEKLKNRSLRALRPLASRSELRGLRKSKLKLNKEEKEELKTEIKRQEELANVYKKYEELKTAAGFLDFGDQVVMTLRLFRQRPKILKEYQKRFKYVLVDEFQDTNWAQNELVKLLAKPKNNLCVVADDDQSIYRFRGAAISNVLEFRKTFPESKVVTLIENYRATQSLLDAAYRLIQHNNPDRLEVKEKIDKKLISRNKGKNTPPKEIYADTQSEEADLVAKEIQLLVKKSKAKKEKINYKDIAILVRANARSDPFLRSLNMKGIPHKFVGSSGLYDQSEIRILISFLNSLVNLEDSLHLFTLSTSEIYNLPMADAFAANSLARRKGKSLQWVFSNLEKQEEELEISNEGREVIAKIVQDLSETREKSRKESVGKILFEFLKRTKFLSILDKEGSVEAETKIQNIARFFDKIREFSTVANNESASAFVEWLATMRGAGDDPATAEFDPETDAVNVMTVHSAKGLEFKVVFMVGLVAGQFPSRLRNEVIPIPEALVKETLPTGDFHLQEERRLFYVGTTRARQSLYFTWARDTGGKRMKKVSPFVLEALDKTVSSALPVKQSPFEKINQFAANNERKRVRKSGEPKIVRLTQSSIDDYKTCAYKYRYVHVLRLPILRHHAVIYGSALHAAVADFYRAKISGKLLPLRKLLEIFENEWVSEGFLSAEHEEKRALLGKKVLTDFWKREKKIREVPKSVEKEFKFSLGDVLIHGRYDRVDETKGKVRIIDFKSTENRTEEEVEKTAKESTQLKVYALSYYKNYKKIPEFIGIYDLGTGLVGGYAPTEKLLEDTEKDIMEVSKNIRKNFKEDSFPAKPKYFGRLPACNFCAYSSICPVSLSKN